MTTLQQDILRLRNQGKSYSQIQKELGCSKGSIAYSCGIGQKVKAKRRCKRHTTEKGALYKKLQGFCYNYGKHRSEKSTLIPLADVIAKIGTDPRCHLTGDEIDLTDMNTYSLDHIIPLASGGRSTLENLGLATKQANACKSDLTVEEFLSMCKKVLIHNGYTVKKL